MIELLILPTALDENLTKKQSSAAADGTFSDGACGSTCRAARYNRFPGGEIRRELCAIVPERQDVKCDRAPASPTDTEGDGKPPLA